MAANEGQQPMKRATVHRQRPDKGRALFYSRDSGGQHDQSPAAYVEWACSQSDSLGVRFTGTADGIKQLIKSGQPNCGDLFFDNCVSGNLLSRPALDALKAEIRRDPAISHVFIPRRDRFARPDNALDGVVLEKELREAGINLVFTNISLPPLRRGHRQNIGEALSAYVEYEQSGRFRDEHAEKMIYAQLQLAKHGFSTGGRAPFGFRRYLVRVDGTVIRQLQDGEVVRQKGHHVVLLPGPADEVHLGLRIRAMLVRIPASRVARILTEEGIPSPDAGRTRTDNGVSHQVSGVWTATSVVNIGRNSLWDAITSCGRRSMGDCRRMTPEGPRFVEDGDFRPDNKPKVIQNPESARITATAHFDPLVDRKESERLREVLDKRGASQRGKPRSRDPEKNPLGIRVFDTACTWPMYREPYLGSFRYTCGLYQQSSGKCCTHNCIDGPTATRFALAAIRQKLLKPGMREQLAARLRAKCKQAENPDQSIERQRMALENQLAAVTSELKTATRNLALAKPEAFNGIQEVVIELQRRKELIEREIQSLALRPESDATPAAMADAALQFLENLPALADDPSNLGRIGELFRRVELQLFLRFRPVKLTKRTVHRLAGGVLTIGAVKEPIQKYTGPTGRRAQTYRRNAIPAPLEDPTAHNKANDSGETADSLGNVNRAGGI
jgi:hypothetical protein